MTKNIIMKGMGLGLGLGLGRNKKQCLNWSWKRTARQKCE